MAHSQKRDKPKDERAKTLASYLFFDRAPELALMRADLKARYQDRSSVMMITGGDVAVNRTLVAEGCRLVYLHIMNMIEEARKDAARESGPADGDAERFGDYAGDAITSDGNE